MEKSDNYYPKWSMSTVPHSGTRYVRDSFGQAGLLHGTHRKTRRYIDDKVDLMWGHCDVGHENWIEKATHEWPDMRHFLVVRNPIHMLCTHFHNTASYQNDKFLRKCNIVRNNLDLYTRIQAHYIEHYDPYIHRVEDPIEDLGKWAGVDLQPGAQSHSRPNDLRAAVDARDVDRIKRIIPLSDLWEIFTTIHSANIAPLYRDQLGYDFWWYNG